MSVSLNVNHLRVDHTDIYIFFHLTEQITRLIRGVYLSLSDNLTRIEIKLHRQQSETKTFAYDLYDCDTKPILDLAAIRFLKCDKSKNFLHKIINIGYTG